MLPSVPAVLLYRSIVARKAHVLRYMGWSYIILRSTNFLRNWLLREQRDRDSKVDPTHLELDELAPWTIAVTQTVSRIQPDHREHTKHE